MAGGKEKKALMELNGKPLLSYVISALLDSRHIDRIIVVGDDLPLPPEVISVSEGKDFVDNLLRGMERCEGKYVLVCSADLPFLAGSAVDKFIEKALPEKAVFAYPIVSKEVCDEKAPQMDKTYISLKEGRYTGGNVVILEREFVLNNRDVIRKAYEARKSPLKLASFLGLGFLFRFLLQQIGLPFLPLAIIEKTMSRAFGGKIKAIPVDYPHLSADVDDEKDLRWVESHLKEGISF